MLRSLVGSEMCIRDRADHGGAQHNPHQLPTQARLDQVATAHLPPDQDPLGIAEQAIRELRVIRAVRHEAEATYKALDQSTHQPSAPKDHLEEEQDRAEALRRALDVQTERLRQAREESTRMETEINQLRARELHTAPPPSDPLHPFSHSAMTLAPKPSARPRSEPNESTLTAILRERDMLREQVVAQQDELHLLRGGAPTLSRLPARSRPIGHQPALCDQLGGWGGASLGDGDRLRFALDNHDELARVEAQRAVEDLAWRQMHHRPMPEIDIQSSYRASNLSGPYLHPAAGSPDRISSQSVASNLHSRSVVTPNLRLLAQQPHQAADLGLKECDARLLSQQQWLLNRQQRLQHELAALQGELSVINVGR
eukprot:TRINITY_DN43254_c0_g1_i1.p1 TRINITY_DN43254_c0_g1~~TRINITY_DN43254_c0_g1_i1.p1  ORF type:complete len:370 (+),score=75.05 TRINITY_DN43254_c0_g1_i1:142-1251(+)